MKAMIFAAGLGTRFKPWTDQHPKALALVNGRSLLERNIVYLQQHGIRQVIVNVHHFPDQIAGAIEKNKGWGSTIQISDEKQEVLETGGGLMKARPYFDREPLLTINVDILTDLDLSALIADHKQHAALITLAVTDRKTSRYLLFNSDDVLCGWRNRSTGEEKIPVPGDELKEKAYSGIAVFDPSVLDLIPYSGKFSLIDAYLHLAPTGRVRGYDHTGDKFVDVGRNESVAIAEKMFP